MENDYSNLEHLVQEVTSLDTARMTLRWALERLSVLDHATRDLEKQLRESRDRQAVAERNAREFEENLSSKTKLFSEREAFYRKIEESVSELSEGKIDLAEFAQKQADLERQGAGLEKEYQEKAQALERSHRELVAQWTERLRQAETHEPQKLSEALQKYDAYRSQLEQSYQARQLTLEQNFHEKERILLQRENELEAISTEKLAQARRLGDMQKAWEWERQALSEKEKSLQERLQAATAEIQELEGVLASADRKYWDASHRWSVEKEQLIQERLEEIRGIQSKNRAVLEERSRLAESESVSRVEAAVKEYQEQILRTERDWEEKTQTLQARWEAERDSLWEETARQEERFRQAQQEVQRLGDALLSQKTDLEAQAVRAMDSFEKAQRQILEQERSRLSEEIQSHDATIQRLREQLKSSRDAFAEASADAEAALASQRKNLLEEFERRLEARESEEASRRSALEAAWQTERAGLAGDIAGRDEQFKRAQAEIAGLRHALDEFRKTAESDGQAKLLAYHEDQEKRAAALQQVWEEEKQALIKQIERRTDAIQALRDHLASVEERVSQSSVREQASLEAARTQWTQEFQKALSAREMEEAARRGALEKTWSAERQRLQGEWAAALEALKKKDENIAQLQQALAEKAGLIRSRDDIMAQFEAMKADLQDQYQKRVQAFESAMQEKQKTLEARWLAERTRWADETTSGARRFDEAQAQIEQLRGEIERQKTTERERMREALAKQQEIKISELEQLAEDEKRTFLQQIERKEAAIKELKGRLNLTENRVTQAAVETQSALETLRTKLTAEFQESLKQREGEEASRRKALEDNWQTERAKLIAGFDEALKTHETEEAGRRKASEESWYAERIRLLEEVSRRNDEFKRAQIEIRGLREAMDRQKTELEANFIREKDALEASYKEALEQRMLRFRKEMQEREAPLQKLTEHLRLAENKLIETSVQAQGALEGLRTKLTAEFEQVLKARGMEESARMHVLEDGWKRERQRLEQQLIERQVVAEEMGERLRKAQDEAAASGSRTAAQMENLRLQLIQEFEGKTRMREEEWTANRRASEETWTAEVKALQDGSQAERSRLTTTLAESQGKMAEMQQDFDAKIRALRAGWIQERDDLAAKLEEEYNQKMSALLAACDGYHKELEARERALEQKEDRIVRREESHGQGKR